MTEKTTCPNAYLAKRPGVFGHSPDCGLCDLLEETSVKRREVETKQKELINLLKWARQEICDLSPHGTGEDEMYVPEHVCNYDYRPDEGYCYFHDMWGRLYDVLEGVE